MTFSPALKEYAARLRQRDLTPSRILAAIKEDQTGAAMPSLKTIANWCREFDAEQISPPNEVHDSDQLLTILEGLRTRTIDAALALKIRSVDEATRAITRLQKMISELEAERKAGISDADLAIVIETVIGVIATDQEVAPMLHGKEVQWLGEIKTALAQLE